MDEFIKHLGLHRTPFAEQVFSNLGTEVDVCYFLFLGL